MGVDVSRYLARIGLCEAPQLSVDGLRVLQLAHLTTVPFENLDIVSGSGVRTDAEWSVPKIVDRGRGGWCFENNGAFAALLAALGFDVARLGAAVLLTGPNQVIDHLTLEVALDEPYLVDVGFGDSFITPLRLNQPGTQDGGSGTFEFINSSQGLTLTKHDDGVPVPQYRFRRINRSLADFDETSERLQADPELHWSQKPFATRLIDGGPDRVTLLSDRLRIVRNGELTETPVEPADWGDMVLKWFAMAPPENGVRHRGV